MFKSLLAQQPQCTMERKRPTVPLGWVCPFTHRCADDCKQYN